MSSEALLLALEPPVDVKRAASEVPEILLARGLSQSAFHHLDTYSHVLEVIERVERELAEGEVGARVLPERVDALRLAALLHDVAKPVTRGEYDGRVIFVAHDTLGATLAGDICERVGATALQTDLAVTLTALHLKIGFMEGPRTDYPPPRLVRAAGPFGEELAVLSWSDRMAAQGPRLEEKHINRHRDLCVSFLEMSRASGPYPLPDYGDLAPKAGRAASRARLRAASC